MIMLTPDNFSETVLTTNSNKLTIVQFTASWCSSCKDVVPTIDRLKELYPDVVFCKVDVDQSPSLADQHEIDKLPTFLFYKNRKITNFLIGNESITRFKTVITDALKS